VAPAFRAIVLASGLLAVFGSEAADKAPQPTARSLPVSFSGDSGRPADGISTDAVSRADLQRMFKARCPGRVERLLSVALPAERPDFKVIADICTCATNSMDTAPDGLPPGQFQVQAAQAALACSKNTITAHNEQRTRKVLGSYLSAQGLNVQQVSAFSQCVADTHWKHTVDASQEASRGAGGAWWATCTEQIGHKGLPPPQD
jgi:hypothetical protein